MTPDELNAKIEELELIAEYGSPVEAAKAAKELAKLKSSQLYQDYSAEMGYDSDNTNYSPYQNAKADTGDDVLKAKVQISGRTHTSLNIFDALRTMGYSESEIKVYCKDNNMKYEAPYPRSSGGMRVN